MYTHHGSRTDDHPGLAHYRLVYVADTGGSKASELVEGAVLRGQASPDARVIAKATIEVPGASIGYTCETTADATGNYTLRVAYPGRYEVNGAT